MNQRHDICLIVPSAGEGKRFIRAAYSLPKPLIDVAGKPMLSHVTEAFPETTHKIVILSEAQSDHAQNILNASGINSQLSFIAPHPFGPAWSISEAGSTIPNDAACFISYNDIAWRWNFSEVMHFIESSSCDAVVFTHEKFHPHLIANNYSAFCKVHKQQLLGIKEKSSYSENWLSEPLSAGLFFCRNAGRMKKYIQQLIEDDNRTDGEFFPSLIFNYYIKDGLKVATIPLDWFIHWGIPEQLNDFHYWQKVFSMPMKLHDTEGVVMMGGSGERMKNISHQNKALIDSGDGPMFLKAVKGNGVRRFSVITNDDVLAQMRSSPINFSYFTIGNPQPTQTYTLKEAVCFLQNKKNFLLLSNDCYAFFDLDEVRKISQNRPVVFGFRPSLTQEKMFRHHTFFSPGSNHTVKKIHPKKRTSPADYGLAGLFFIPDGRIFDELDHFTSTEEGSSVDHYLAWLAEKGTKIAYAVTEYYVHMGTEEEYLEYIFWSDYFSRK